MPYSNCFESVYQVVNNALKSVTEAQIKTSKKVDKKFKKALSAVEMDESDAAMAGGTSTAEANDNCSVTILETWRWPERLPVMLTLPDFDQEMPGRDGVEFLIHKSLIDNSPTGVKCELAN